MDESPKPSPLRRRLLGASLITSLGLAGLQPARGAQAQNRYPTSRPKLAVVLGGGSARGFAHIGVIKALEAAEIQPDLIVGCSAGSLVGVFWAAGFSGRDMEQLATQIKDSEILDLVSGSAPNLGMVGGHSLQRFVNRSLQNRAIETLRTPFVSVATEFPSGRLATFSHGDAGFAVRASCSIPGIFVPARKEDGSNYLDGGLVSPLPVQTAQAFGADVVVAVDIGGSDPTRDDDFGVYKLILRSFEIMSDSLRRHEAAQADIVIRPRVERVSSTDFGARNALIRLGEHAGNRLVPVILEMLQRPVRIGG